VTPLPVYEAGDYDLPSYSSRMQEICCLEYSLPYLPKSGFALFSLATRGNVDLVSAILSYQVLNAATPVLIAVVVFGWAMYAVERRLNGEQFETPSAGVYFAMGACPRYGYRALRADTSALFITLLAVSLSTFGFGDLAPKTRTGRILTVFWTIASVLSLSAFTSVVSSQLTLSQLAFAPITSFTQLEASDFCIEGDYMLARELLSGTYSVPDDQLEANGVMFGSISTCAEAVSSGAKKVFTSDKPLLNWLANSYFGTGNLYVSESLRSNPLSVAFRAGSTLRPAVDTAIIDMLTNLSWSESHEALMNTWFPKGVADAPFTDQTLDVPMFAAACALVGTTLAIAGVQLALEQRLIFARAHDKSAELGADFSGFTANPLKTGAARIEAAAAAAAGARDAARAAAAAAAAAEALATEVEQLAAALDAAEGKEAKVTTPRSPRIGALELDI
jgi:hypothetical protein